MRRNRRHTRAPAAIGKGSEDLHDGRRPDGHSRGGAMDQDMSMELYRQAQEDDCLLWIARAAKRVGKDQGAECRQADGPLAEEPERVEAPKHMKG